VAGFRAESLDLRFFSCLNLVFPVSSAAAEDTSHPMKGHENLQKN